MKIASKISLSFLVISILVTVIPISIFYLISKDSLQNTIFNQLEIIARTKTQHVQTYLKMLKVSIGQLSKSIVLEEFLKSLKENPEGNREAFDVAMRRLRNTKEANSEIYDFLLLDTTGRVIASTNEKDMGANKSGDAYFVGAQKLIYIKDAYYSDVVKERIITASGPLLDSKTKETLGVLVARVRLTGLNAIMREPSIASRSLETYIVNKYGYMITPSKFLKDTFLKQEANTVNFRGSLLHFEPKVELNLKEHISIAPNYLGETVLGAHAYIPEMKWSILAEFDKTEAFAPLERMRTLFLIILFTVPLIAWILGAFISELIARPISKLHEGAEIIGEGNLEYKVGTKANDEIGQLSRAFDKMTENLKHTTTSIGRLNEEIAERKKLEQKLSTTAQEWETTFNSISDLISIQDKDFRLIRVNKAYADFFKMKPEELIGKACFFIVHGTSEPCLGCLNKKTIETEKPQKLEYLEQRFGLYLEVTTCPIFDANKEVIGTVHLIKDITARKKAEEAMMEVVKIKAHFTSMVSHELRTPLTAIKESISIVLDGSSGELSNEQKDFLTVSQRNVDRLARLINDVLDFQKLESGKFEFNIQENDMNEVIEEVQNTMAPVAKNKGLDIILNLEENLPKINFDRDKIIQVLTNLISNSIKFTEKGSITVISKKKDNCIQLIIKDTGPGIKNEDLSRLFIAFEQLGKVEDRKTGSTGLGLAISKEIIEKHSGKIWADSEPGKGSSFHIIIPIVERRGQYDKRGPESRG